MKKLHLQRTKTGERTEQQPRRLMGGRSIVASVSVPVFGYKVLRTVNTLYPTIGGVLDEQDAAYYVDQEDWEVTVE